MILPIATCRCWPACSDDAGILHAAPDETGALPTDEAIVAPFAKLLADGEIDGIGEQALWLNAT